MYLFRYIHLLQVFVKNTKKLFDKILNLVYIKYIEFGYFLSYKE